jgi:hypothetical protein
VAVVSESVAFEVELALSLAEAALVVASVLESLAVNSPPPPAHAITSARPMRVQTRAGNARPPTT